jgi:hypothetical protein
MALTPSQLSRLCLCLTLLCLSTHALFAAEPPQTPPTPTPQASVPAPAQPAPTQPAPTQPARASASGTAPTPGVPAWPAAYAVIQSKCLDCHGGKKEKGGINLKNLEKDPSVAREYELWNRVLEALESGEMPPDDAKPLDAAQKQTLLAWLNPALDHVARANAGDPGPVMLRRLTNHEYDYTVRDLTGLQLGLAKDFVPDGGGGEGFSNVGDTLFVSPQQLEKYFEAARTLADHATILPGTGIRFSPNRVGLRGPAQVRSAAESAMFVWYQKAAMDHLPKDGEDLLFPDYLTACWKWKHREKTGAASLLALASEQKLEPAFLENWWNMLNSEEPKSSYLDLVRLPWRNLPPPNDAAPRELPEPTRQSIAKIGADLHSWFLPEKWSVLRAQQDADELRPYNFDTPVQQQRVVHLVVADLGDGNKGDIVLLSNPGVFRKGKREPYWTWLREQLKQDRSRLESLKTQPAPAPQGEPAAEVARLEKQIRDAEQLLARLGKHPKGLETPAETLALEAPIVLSLPLPEGTTRFLAEGKLDLKNPELEFASLQWKATVEAPPNPAGILPGVITLWKRGTAAQKEVSKNFGPFHQIFSMNLEHRLNAVASNRHRSGKPGNSIYYFSDAQLAQFLPQTENDYLKQMHEDWRFVWNKVVPKQLEPEWDRKVLAHLKTFAARAWRRPVSPEEEKQFETIYRSAISLELDRESAAREVLVRVLVAPGFLFKLEEAGPPGIHPVRPIELATRLSYFLWSSLPDAPLTAKAQDGSLLQPEVLKSETLRMLRDPKANALAREFAAQWFQFQGFDAYSKIDTQKFPEFTPELRRDLHTEIDEFFTFLLRENRPVHEILSADYTFLNERLAKHYGIPEISGDAFRKVPVAAQARGGILGMGAVLARTSYPHRTSPVLRGNFVLRSILGTPTPPPPNDVPKLDETVAHAKTLRERLERHRADRACSSCHDKIDPLGFALERFDPLGRLRQTDDTGIAVDDSAKTKDGRTLSGLKGLQGLLSSKNDEFSSLFCKKLLGYALGRPVLPSDKTLLEDMKKSLLSKDPTFAGAILAVVQSPQFKNRHEPETP